MKTTARASTAAAIVAALMPATIPTQAQADGLLAPIWFGAYAGIHLGADWTDVDINGVEAFSSEAAVGGVHAGFNFQLFGLVAGIEADADLTGTESTSTIFPTTAAELSSDWLMSVRGRLGAAFGPVLAYGTAGVAWTETNVVAATPGFTTIESSETQTGFVYGAGLEAYVSPNMTVRIEALRYEFDSDFYTIGGGLPDVEFDPSSTVVRAGVSLHF